MSAAATVLALACGCSASRPVVPSSVPSVVDREIRAKADAACGVNLPIEQRSKVDSELIIKCLEWVERGEQPAERVHKVLVELVGNDTRELEAAGVVLTPVIGRFYSAGIALDAMMSLGQLSSVLRIHYERPNSVDT